MHAIKTVKVRVEEDFVVINESDFDPNEMELYVEPVEPAKKPKKNKK